MTDEQVGQVDVAAVELQDRETERRRRRPHQYRSRARRPSHASTGDDDDGHEHQQGDDCAEEIAAAERQFDCSIQVFEDLDIKNDAEEVAALLTALDAIVTCRCWITAFAGALGVPTYCFSAPFNMQMMDLPYDPWAPMTKIYYRAYEESWEGCMRAISGALEQDFAARDP